jgi:hypothetical protein
MTQAMLDIIDGPLLTPSRRHRGNRTMQNRRRACREKVEYTTLTLAQHEARRHRQQVYTCVVCGLWHLTSQKETTP